MFISTKPSDQRRGKGHSTADIVAKLSPKLMGLMFAPNGGLVAMFEPPAVQGVGSYGGFQFMLQDQGANTLADLDRVAHQIVGASRARKDLTGLLTTFSANDPQVLVTIDREKAKAMNIPLSQITNTLSVFMGSEYINDFDYNNRTYRVFVQADQAFRMSARDLHSYYVRSDSGMMVPLDNVVRVTESAGPPVITHYNLFRAVEIDGSPAPGYSSGQGLAAMEDLAKKTMMPGMTYQWTGLTLDEIESSGKALIIFGLGILVVYLTLSAQYESFALPFIILLAVPMAVLGALGLVSAARPVQRCLLPDRPGHADRPLGQKRHPDCRVCRAIAAQGTVHRRGSHRSRGTASAADPHDLVRLHPGHPAAGLRHRRGRPGTALRGHHHRGRHVALHGAQPVLHSRAVCDSEKAVAAWR